MNDNIVSAIGGIGNVSGYIGRYLACLDFHSRSVIYMRGGCDDGEGMKQDPLIQAEGLCKKLGDRRLYYANCGTVAEDFSKTGNQDFQEVAHPEDPFWCEILVGVNLLPELVAYIKRLEGFALATSIKAGWEMAEAQATLQKLREGSVYLWHQGGKS